MKVIYHEKFKGECPYLIDGKAYEVEDTVEFDEDGLFYAIIDESKDSMWRAN